MREKQGFTLIEMMVVVAILAIIAAIAIPNLMRSRVQANEASAIEDLSVICQAQISYNAGHMTFSSFADLTDDSDGPPFLDDGWVEGREKNGYIFSMAAAGPTAFVCFADPVEHGVTGSRFYRVDTSGVVRFNASGRPSDTDPPVGG
ncbi:MAG: hypothetical protein RLZZ303_2890 [Candidatus Hydrogenedentota bacterium]|jgi:prepilin-type N-terminal cleavage/methylation domain-containing protein